MYIDSSLSISFPQIPSQEKRDQNLQEHQDLALPEFNGQEDKAQNTKESLKQEEERKKEDPNELSLEERALVNKLSAIDAKVKAHEMAHVSAGGGLTGGASFTYTRGPDNKMYAIAGEVSISLQKGNTPEETIANARQVRAAAMAPSDPSPQDYKVAANAMKMELEARAWANRIKAEEDKKAQEEMKEEREEQTTNNTSKQSIISAYTKNLRALA